MRFLGLALVGLGQQKVGLRYLIGFVQRLLGRLYSLLFLG